MSHTIEELMESSGFTPDGEQMKAIESTEGPNFIKAGAGSGKSTLLMWFLIHLIVVLKVDPRLIYVTTFTEKAAKHLKSKLIRKLYQISKITKKTYDLSGLTISTVHASCQKILRDSRFFMEGELKPSKNLLDPRDQYLFLSNRKFWNVFLMSIGMTEEDFKVELKSYFRNTYKSKKLAVKALQSLFNRWSEENLSVSALLAVKPQNDGFYEKLVKIYEIYLEYLEKENLVDFSLLQQEALNHILKNDESSNVYKYIVVDEYQDTSSIQEQIFFRLAAGSKNITVVGDSDQSIFRFRAAVVENITQFPARCIHYGLPEPKVFNLRMNYRSRSSIVEFSEQFMRSMNWTGDNGKTYRTTKNMIASKQDADNAVIATSNLDIEEVAEEVADLVVNLLETGKVKDLNQIAFLFPKIRGNDAIDFYKQALESRGISTYAPRTNRLLESEEVMKVVGIMLKVFGMPALENVEGDYRDFLVWLQDCESLVHDLLKTDTNMKEFVEKYADEVAQAKSDYLSLFQTVKQCGWNLSDNYVPSQHKLILKSTKGLSASANLGTKKLDEIAVQRMKDGKPFSLQYIINYASSLDWSCLDFFWRMQGLDEFSNFFNDSDFEKNMSSLKFLKQMTEYLAKFMNGKKVLSGGFLTDEKFVYSFFSGFLYPLYCLGDTEEEDKLESFPSGKVAMLTIHQAKGLEFQVVFLGMNVRRQQTPRLEEIVRPATQRLLEPLDRIDDFDTFRMFYVALTRPINLLILLHPKGRKHTTYWAFKPLLKSIKRLPQFNVVTLPDSDNPEPPMQRTYSITSDILPYLLCKRQYRYFAMLGFIRSRAQLQLFGEVIHKTLEDINNRRKKNSKGAEM